MHDEVPAPVRTGMNYLALDSDAAELRPAILSHSFVVIAWNVDNLGSLPHFAEKLLQNIVVRLRPVDPTPNAPEVHNIANKIDARAVVPTQTI